MPLRRNRRIPMQLKATELHDHLAGGLAPLYLVAGDEALIVQEACDAIVVAAQAQGFDERSVLHVERGFSWGDIVQDAASLSLFAARRIIDVRVPGNSFDREASTMLRAYADRPHADTLLLIRSGRLDPRQRSSAWFKALGKAGVIVLVWPVTAAELPRWLDGRLRMAGLDLQQDARALLAQQVEGNLLAAVQEIEKLKLAGLPAPVTAEALTGVLENSAHYDVFQLIDAILAGQVVRVSRALRTLRQEGAALFAILGALTSQLRRMQAGQRLPPQRQRLVDGFLRRLGSAEVIDRVLAQCALVDAQGKGQLLGDAWISLENLCLRLAGTRALRSLERQLPHMMRP